MSWRWIALAAFVLLLVAGSAGQHRPSPPAEADSMFTQSATAILNREFTDSNISFLLMDAKSGRLLGSRWDDPSRAIPMGSLVKPFTAIAYGAQHDFLYPTHICRGTATGCWRPRGHGRVTLTTAIAQSCNSYFRMLAATLRASDLESTVAAFGIEEPDRSASGANLIGIGDGWRVSPVRMAHAYLELGKRRDQPGVREIVEGMTLSAREGTGAAIGRALPRTGALVKTGTAPCTHSPRAPGDGFAVAIWPADEPRILLLVREHGKPGAEAAGTAGEMLRRISQ
ncbi:MAG: penicillin-binding transpeptidase domain-containing protein [Terriglobales bacterium]